MLGTESLGDRPVRWLGVVVPPDDYHGRTAPQLGPYTGRSDIDADHYQRRPPVPGPGRCWIGRDIEKYADVGSDP
jgi:hypothetical protein